MRIVNTKQERIIRPSTLEYFDYELGPYVGCEHRCVYCYTQNEPELDWDREVGVFPDFRERLIKELDALGPQVIYFGLDTDPYQPIEAEYRHTRQALEELGKRGFSASILTKSDIFTRDFDLLAAMPESAVGASIAFNEEACRLLFEKSSKPTSARLRALAEAKAAGIETYVLISPVMPLITDVDALIEETRRIADTIWIYSLEVKGTELRSWRRMERVMEEHFPDMLETFREIALSPLHPYWTELDRKLRARAARDGLNLDIHL